MHRIDSKNSINGKFVNGSGSDREKRDGTVLDSEWFNAVQEEICNVLESHNIKPMKGNNNQLAKIISSMTNTLESIDKRLKTLEDGI